MIILYWVNFLEDSSQRVIPKFVGLVEIGAGKPQIANIVSILNFGKGIFSGFGVFELFVNAVVLVDDVLDKIFAFLDVFCFLSVLSIHLLVVLSKLVCVFSLLLLGQNLLTSISGYFILDAIALVHLAFYVVLLVI